MENCIECDLSIGMDYKQYDFNLSNTMEISSKTQTNDFAAHQFRTLIVHECLPLQRYGSHANRRRRSHTHQEYADEQIDRRC